MTMHDSANLIRMLLAFLWVPLLMMAGILDQACHRHLRIEYTAGLPKSVLHLLMWRCSAQRSLRRSIWSPPPACCSRC